jgi:glucose-6-phosphate isomerase
MTDPEARRALEHSTAARLERWVAEDVASRLWARDGSLWEASGKSPDEVSRWLGWLELPESMRSRIGELNNLARSVRDDGYAQAAVLGMGGSSLAPELFATVFGESRGEAGTGMRLRILDSTHPDAVRSFRDWATVVRTVFCVSSKSGTTTEPLAFHAAMADVAPALDFLAITDPGTPLVELAQSQEFRGIVEAPSDVGGRYSALSVFGLLPAVLAGVDIEGLLHHANEMVAHCRRPADENPGLKLGAMLGEAALAGRDKLTILTSPRLASFGDWVEQLVAESTGKLGTGIVPIVGEPAGDPATYGEDRFIVLLTLSGEPDASWRTLAEELEGHGHPGVHIDHADPLELGGEFVRWEVATAAAGMVLAIDPFDQPDVQQAKDATRRLLEAYRRKGSLPSPATLVAEDGIAVSGASQIFDDRPVSVEGALWQLVELAAPGDYFGILAYVPPELPVLQRLQALRSRMRDSLGLATTLGIGPRFLHSTGQLHKGGPPSGLFLQITADPRSDLAIPGWDESFGVLVAAQALGDLQALQERGRRVLRVHLGDPEPGLDRLAQLLDGALRDLVEA